MRRLSLKSTLFGVDPNFINENSLLEKCPHPVLKYIINDGAFTLAERIFSVKNSIDLRYKIITILGFRIKLIRY